MQKGDALPEGEGVEEAVGVVTAVDDGVEVPVRVLDGPREGVPDCVGVMVPLIVALIVGVTVETEELLGVEVGVGDANTTSQQTWQ